MLPGVEGCACEDLSASVVVGVLPRAHKTPRFQKITKKKITLFMSFTDLLRPDLERRPTIKETRNLNERSLRLGSLSWSWKLNRCVIRSTELSRPSNKRQFA